MHSYQKSLHFNNSRLSVRVQYVYHGVSEHEPAQLHMHPLRGAPDGARVPPRDRGRRGRRVGQRASHSAALQRPNRHGGTRASVSGFKSLLRWIDLMQRTTVLHSWSVQFYIILSAYGKTVARELLRCHHAIMAASVCRNLGITRMWLSCDCVSISHRSLH